MNNRILLKTIIRNILLIKLSPNNFIKFSFQIQAIRCSNLKKIIKALLICQ